MFEAAFSHSPVPCAILGHDSHLEVCNDAFARMLGYSPNELKGQPVSKFLADATGNRLEVDTAANRAPKQLCFKHKDGASWPLPCLIAPLDAGTDVETGTIVQVLNSGPPAETSSHTQRPTLACLALDHIREAVYLVGDDKRILDANKAACETLGYSLEELTRLTVFDIDPNLAKDIHLPHPGCVKHSPIVDTHHRKRNGEIFPVKVSKIEMDYQGNTYALAFALDISHEQWLEKSRFAILESLTKSAPLNKTLRMIVDYVEMACPEALASIMLVNDAGTHLEPGSANKLPARYLEAIQTVPIAEGAGACGTAASLRESVQIADISTHPYFENHKALALESGLRSCWSSPLLGANGDLLGTLCIYLRHPGQPTELGVKMIARRAGHFAALAIEKDRAEKQLHESQQRFQDIFTHSLDALALLEVTPDGLQVLEANPAMERMVQLPHDRIIGRTLEDVVPPNVAQSMNSKYRVCAEEARVLEWEAQLDLPGGLRHLHYTLIPLWDPKGIIYRLIVIARDNTHRRRTETMLHSRQEEFRALVENSPDGIIRYSPAGEILYLNPKLLGLLDKKKETAPGEQHDFESLIMRSDQSNYRETLQKVITTGFEGHLIIHLDSANEDLMTCQDVRLVPEFTPEGKVASVLSVMRDITSLKRTEVQLRTLVENYPTYLSRRHLNGQLLFANPAFRTWLGFGQNTPLSEMNFACLTPEEVIQIRKGQNEAAKKKCLVEKEMYLSKKQEWHRLLFVPEKDELGNVTSTLTVGLDISRQKQTDAELRESRCLLRELAARRESELEAERKRIAHEIHDELGQLLTILRMNLSMTSSYLDPEAKVVRQKLADMRDLVDRTIKTVRNIATTLRPAVLNAGLASALEWLTHEFSSHTHIQCNLDMQGGIELDEERAIVIFRVVQESLSNIGRHSGADQAWIHLSRNVTGYRLTIRDNGRGFNPRTVTGKKSFGLIGMQERVLSLHGECNLTSAPNLGTTLEIQIPVHPKRKTA